MSEEKKIDVKFINSFSMAVTDIDCNVQHILITLVQETESKKFRCYFDVVDPRKVKIAQE